MIKGTIRRKTILGDGVSRDLIVDSGETVVVKLANLYNKFVVKGKTPKSLKSETIALLHKKWRIRI